MSGDNANSFSPILFLPFFIIANEKGLLCSTLQQEAETWPNFGMGNATFGSSTIYDPSGIEVFLSIGTMPTILSLF